LIATSGPRPPRVSQFTVSTTAIQIAGINWGRLGIIISNPGTGVGYIGFDSGVTASTGYGIPPNGYVVLDNPAQIWAISSGAGTTLTTLEENAN